jgi:Na+/H+-dicarboxylate symporter
MDGLEQKVSELFGNLPALSPGAKETAAKVVPWVLIVLGVLGMLAWLSSIRFFFGMMGMASHFGVMGPGILTMVQLLIAPIVQVLVIYGAYLMLSKRRLGWRIAFYALVFGFVSHILAISVFGLILDCIFAYFLFQIREFFIEA